VQGIHRSHAQDSFSNLDKLVKREGPTCVGEARLLQARRRLAAGRLAGTAQDLPGQFMDSRNDDAEDTQSHETEFIEDGTPQSSAVVEGR
jgi:hypothetical protein